MEGFAIDRELCKCEKENRSASSGKGLGGNFRRKGNSIWKVIKEQGFRKCLVRGGSKVITPSGYELIIIEHAKGKVDNYVHELRIPARELFKTHAVSGKKCW